MGENMLKRFTVAAVAALVATSGCSPQAPGEASRPLSIEPVSGPIPEASLEDLSPEEMLQDVLDQGTPEDELGEPEKDEAAPIESVIDPALAPPSDEMLAQLRDPAVALFPIVVMANKAASGRTAQILYVFERGVERFR